MSKVNEAAEEYLTEWDDFPGGMEAFLAGAQWLLEQAEKMQQNVLPETAFGPNPAFTPLRAVCLADLKALFEDEE